PLLRRLDATTLAARHASLGSFRLAVGPSPDGEPPELLFTDNETNTQRLFGAPNPTPFVRDAFHRLLIQGERGAVNAEGTGTKAAPRYALAIPAGEERTVRLRLFSEEATPDSPLGASFEATFSRRRAEADAFYDALLPASLSADEKA